MTDTLIPRLLGEGRGEVVDENLKRHTSYKNAVCMSFKVLSNIVKSGIFNS